METILEIPIDQLVISPTNPRKHFNAAAIDELAESMKKVGLIEPLVVRQLTELATNLSGEVNTVPTTFEIVCGERRYRAAKIIGLPTLLCQVRALTDDEVFDIQISENLQREDISPLDESDAYVKLHSMRNFSMRDIADKFGKSEEYVFGRLRLVTLIPEARHLLENDVMPIAHAIKIAQLEENLQKMALSRMVETYHVGDGERTTWAGGKALKFFFDANVLMSLTAAAFNTRDPNLNPEMGACTHCQYRTGNTLFHDITDGNRCLRASCFNLKYVNHYKKLKEKLSKKHNEEFVYAETRAGAAKEFKELGPIKLLGSFEMSTEKKKGFVPAVLVGNDGEGKVEFAYIRELAPKSNGEEKKKLDPKEKKKLERAEKKAQYQAFYFHEELLRQLTDKSPKSIREYIPYAMMHVAADYLFECDLETPILYKLVRRHDLHLQVEMHSEGEWKEDYLNNEFIQAVGGDERFIFRVSRQQYYNAIFEVNLQKIGALFLEAVYLFNRYHELRLAEMISNFELDKKEANMIATKMASGKVKEEYAK